MFKNGWFLEGTARWSEYAIRQGVGRAGGLPSSQSDLETLFGMRYDASAVWCAMAALTDSRGKLTIPRELRAVTYAGTRTRVIQDDILLGTRFMKEVLEALDAQDDLASKDFGLGSFAWKEIHQGDKRNNKYIWRAVIDVAKRHQRRSVPLRRMVSTLGNVD